MHPDGVFGFRSFQYCFAELVVDTSIRFPLPLVVKSVLGEVVEKGPDRFIAKPFVILFNVTLGDEDRVDIFGL